MGLVPMEDFNVSFSMNICINFKCICNIHYHLINIDKTHGSLSTVLVLYESSFRTTHKNIRILETIHCVWYFEEVFSC